MLSNPLFGASYCISAPAGQTQKPPGVSVLEQQSNLYLTAGPFQTQKSMAPFDAFVTQATWSILTDEDALAVAKNAGADVSITKSFAENQAAIDTFVQTQNLQNQNGGLGYYIKRYQEAFSAESRQLDGSPMPNHDGNDEFFPG